MFFNITVISYNWFISLCYSQIKSYCFPKIIFVHFRFWSCASRYTHCVRPVSG